MRNDTGPVASTGPLRTDDHAPASLTPQRPRLCVFCGSARGRGSTDLEAARRTGHAIARRGAELVYGGGAAGLMGAVADAALEAGARVVGVVPEPLVIAELAHPGLTRLEVVSDMHRRKARMAEAADAFLVLPGGLGTFEEMFEIWTWAHLGLHQRPLGILNVDGYFDPLLRLVESAVDAGFVPPRSGDLVIVREQPEQLVDDMLARAAAAGDAPTLDPLQHIGELLTERNEREASG
ncbi:LOG family protein [Embleya sp. NPDC001921]